MEIGIAIAVVSHLLPVHLVFVVNYQELMVKHDVSIGWPSISAKRVLISTSSTHPGPGSADGMAQAANTAQHGAGHVFGSHSCCPCNIRLSQHLKSLCESPPIKRRTLSI